VCLLGAVLWYWIDLDPSGGCETALPVTSLEPLSVPQAPL
jgi:hypothetical protein